MTTARPAKSMACMGPMLGLTTKQTLA
jgi:hypothetical protein